MKQYNRMLRRAFRASKGHEEVDEQRCSGRTTALAMEAIAHAILAPGAPTTINSHIGELPTRAMAESRKRRACELIERLGLLHMRCYVQAETAYVVSDMFTTNPWSIE